MPGKNLFDYRTDSVIHRTPGVVDDFYIVSDVNIHDFSHPQTEYAVVDVQIVHRQIARGALLIPWIKRRTTADAACMLKMRVGMTNDGVGGIDTAQLPT